MENRSFVSVVTPFYNTQEYLAECIESVLRQTYTNFEYILVDNCSTDGSSEIAAHYAAQDPSRVRVIRNQTFLSQVANYNSALTSIAPTARYVKLVQADDWLYPECLQRLVELAESDPSGGIVSSYRLRGDSVEGSGIPHDRTIFSGREIARLHLTARVFAFGSPTTVLYRADIIRNHSPFYDESTFFDDADACYRELQSCNFGFVHQILSFSRLDEESIRGRVLDFNPNALDLYLQLTKYGPSFLDGEEADAALRQARSAYYSLLAQRLLYDRSPEFWRFHKSGLQSAGLRIDKLRLARYTLLEILRLIANPGTTCARIARVLRNKLRSSQPHPSHSAQSSPQPSAAPVPGNRA